MEFREHNYLRGGEHQRENLGRIRRYGQEVRGKTWSEKRSVFIARRVESFQEEFIATVFITGEGVTGRRI